MPGSAVQTITKTGAPPGYMYKFQMEIDANGNKQQIY